MFFHAPHNLLLLPELRSETESEVVELHVVGACYTYFGWFPWADFEGEHFSEEQIHELTGGRTSAGTIDASACSSAFNEELGPKS